MKIRIRRPKLQDFHPSNQKLITSGCGARGSDVIGGEVFHSSCNKHDMHWQAGTGWLFPVLAVALSVYTGLYWFLFLWIGEYVYGNFLLFVRTLLDADEVPDLKLSLIHVLIALLYFVVLTLVGFVTYSYTWIGWHSVETIARTAQDRDRGVNPRRSINEVVRSWFGSI